MSRSGRSGGTLSGKQLPTVALIEQNRVGAAIWRVAWPVMLMHALYTAMTVVDMFWVGKLGHVEVAAVALSGSVLGVLFALGQVFSVAVLAMAARAAGRGDREGIGESFRHVLLLSVLFSVVVAIAGMLLSGRVLSLFRAAPDVVAAGRPYLVVVFAYMPAFFSGMVVYSLFQALGDTRTPMFIVLASNLLNMVLDPILIFGWFGMPRLGLLGAALATAASHGVWLAAIAVVMHRRRLVALRGPLSARTMKTALRIGIPAGLHGITRPVTGMVMFGIVTGFGTAATAAFGIGLRILEVMFIYLGGLGSAVETLVGQSLGLGKPDSAVQVTRRVTLAGLLLQLGFVPLLFAFAPQLVSIFSSNPEVVSVGTGYLRVLVPVLVIGAATFAWAGAQRGAGDTRPPMVAALIANWAVKIPVAWALVALTGFGLTGVWVAIGASILVEAVLLGFWYYRGGWQRRELSWK